MMGTNFLSLNQLDSTHPTSSSKEAIESQLTTELDFRVHLLSSWDWMCVSMCRPSSLTETFSPLSHSLVPINVHRMPSLTLD